MLIIAIITIATIIELHNLMILVILSCYNRFDCCISMIGKIVNIKYNYKYINKTK
jgi:hypothetical protein